MDSWNFRDEFMRSVNQWYLVLLFIVGGGLIGYLMSYLVPAPYRATADLYIGINITRVNEMEYLIPLAKEEPLNLDDYKNWQLKQVADIISSASVIKNTLTTLRETDPDWEEISLEKLSQAMDIYWYDTGTWQLEVVLPVEEQAAEAVQTWLDTGYQKITELLVISDSVALLDAQLVSLNVGIGQIYKRMAALESFLSSSEDWIAVLGEFTPDLPLDEDTLAEFNTWILLYQDDEASWRVPAEDYPATDQGAGEYLSWLKDVQSTAAIELEESQSQITCLNNIREQVLPQYHEALDDSLGLSANLVLQPNSSLTAVDQARSTGAATLGGGILGLFAWLLVVIFRIKGSRVEND